jgi:hypothetical protein
VNDNTSIYKIGINNNKANNDNFVPLTRTPPPNCTGPSKFVELKSNLSNFLHTRSACNKGIKERAIVATSTYQQRRTSTSKIGNEVNKNIISLDNNQDTVSTMKSSITFLALAAVSSVSAFAPTQSSGKSSTTKVGLTKEEILSSPNTIELGKIYDPLGLSELGGDETLAWFRHSEVKHGRVAMAAFVGWCATAGAGLHFPGELAHGLDFSAVPTGGVEAWDAVPGWGKAQMLLFAGLIEFHDELFYSRRGTHYMRGGIPGKVRRRKKKIEKWHCI